eukprot:5260483-Pyramimonas_sp.AAC.1
MRGAAGAAAATGDDQCDGSTIGIVMPPFLFMLVYMIAAAVAVCYLAKGRSRERQPGTAGGE